MPGKYLNMPEMNEEFGWPVDTLRYWRQHGDGPPSFKIGRRVMYDRADVEAWIADQKNAQVGGAA